MDLGNFLIPLVLVFCIILAFLWMLGRCRLKIIRRRKNPGRDIVLKLNSGLKLQTCNFVAYCCWSSNDSSADIIKYYDKIHVVNYEPAIHSSDECVICKDTFDSEKQICTFNCNHHFHVICIVKWMTQQKKCPLCWADINHPMTV